MDRRPPSTTVALSRALTKRCPWCGQGRLFRRWFSMLERCPRCGLRFEREPGAFLGAVAINYGVTGLAFIAVLIAVVAATAPDVPIAALTIAGLVVTTVVAVGFYPFSKTLWVAIDLLLHRMDRQDADPYRRSGFG